MTRKKKLIITAVALIITSIVAGVIYYVKTNTHFLNSVSEEDIKKNNFNSDESIDLAKLTPQTLIVPEKFKKDVFATERKINLPEGFKISVYAAGFTKSRAFDFDDKDNMYLADWTGKVYLIKNPNGDSVSDEIIEIDKNLKTSHGVDFYKNDLYVAEENKLTVYRNIKDNGKFDKKETLVANLPTGGHPTRTVVIGPDEKIYLSIGSSCNVCEEKDKRRAAVVRYNLDGSGEEMYSEGLRNSVGILFHEGKLWSVDNGRDVIGDDIPPEEVNILEKGKHYGWPYCYGKQIVNPEYEGKREDFCKNQTTNPTYEMQAHSAPLGLAFFPETTDLPKSLGENLFITFHGSWNRTVPTGYKVVRINTSSNDSKTIDFATGWLDETGKVWGRPVDVKFDSKGNMYVSDDQAGAVYLISGK